MPISVELPSEIERLYREIFKERPDEGIKKLLIRELKRRLAEFRLIDSRLRKRYGLSFEEFKDRKIVEKHLHSFEVEQDYCDWELALDGIKTIQGEIEKLEKLL